MHRRDRRGDLLHDQEVLNPHGFTLRPAAPADANELALTVSEGFEGYRAFAPAGWEPPAEVRELAPIEERLRDPDTWCLLGERDGHVAGHVAFMPAKASRWGSLEPGLAHLWQLFVRQSEWGSGLATALHAEMLAEAGRRGFTALRLFTPAGQARARRFYEREGWTTVGTPFFEDGLKLDIVEYRRGITG